ncbi:hypothetical protein [Arsenicicoccus dermatophilus]|uniref:hypothetical protein n=1 Tax=Arsenicicoccus dermatophilus TaxID=1076331 RepID=UPI001F4C641B|nr:hypothetical protein [Arsenicicoccus dermatophilus]MCH8614448.1 hypothetical protein [Arsenicicoccus dermatophilus]
MIPLLLLLTYLTVAPDPFSLALTRGLAGAAAGAVGGRGWRAGAGEGVRAARARRAAGRDLTGRARVVARAGLAGTFAVVTWCLVPGTWRQRRAAAAQSYTDTWSGTRAQAVVPEGIDETAWDMGADARRAQALRTPATSVAGENPPEPAPAGPGNTDEENVMNIRPRRQQQPQQYPPQHQHQQQQHQQQSAQYAPQYGRGLGPAENGSRAATQMGQTELTSLADVRAEAHRAAALMEVLSEYVAAVRAWGEYLPERWGSAEWGTADLDRAVAEVSEATEALVDAEGILEALEGIHRAIERAEDLADVLAEHGAYGDTRGFNAA